MRHKSFTTTLRYIGLADAEFFGKYLVLKRTGNRRLIAARQEPGNAHRSFPYGVFLQSGLTPIVVSH